MQNRYLVCSSQTHLRFAAPLALAYKDKGYKVTFITLDRVNTPEGGGVVNTLTNHPILKSFPIIEYDGGLTDIPPAGFRSLSRWKRWRLAKSAKYPKISFSDSIIIFFHDTGALEKTLLIQSKKGGAHCIYIQDGFLPLRPQNIFTIFYYQLIKNSKFFPFFPTPQASGLWHLGLFFSPFWKQYAERWHIGACPTCVSIGLLQTDLNKNTSALEHPKQHSKQIKIGILCSNFENYSNFDNRQETRYIENLIQLLKKIHPAPTFLIRPHPTSQTHINLTKIMKKNDLTYELSPSTDSLSDFLTYVTISVSLGSFAAFELLQLQHPCFLILKPYGKIYAKIAQKLKEPDPDTLLHFMFENIQDLLNGKKTAADIHKNLCNQFKDFMQIPGLSPNETIQLIEKTIS